MIEELKVDNQANGYTYRKRPLLVEAFQMTEERGSNNVDWPNWLHEAWQKDVEDVGYLGLKHPSDSDMPRQFVLTTLEGIMLVNWDDYIIQGTENELYICRLSIFNAIYEKVI